MFVEDLEKKYKKLGNRVNCLTITMFFIFFMILCILVNCITLYQKLNTKIDNIP